MFKMFVTGDSINASIFYQSNDIYQGWTFVQQRWKIVC